VKTRTPRRSLYRIYTTRIRAYRGAGSDLFEAVVRLWAFAVLGEAKPEASQLTCLIGQTRALLTILTGGGGLGAGMASSRKAELARAARPGTP
jgi:hypothetical protein